MPKKRKKPKLQMRRKRFNRVSRLASAKSTGWVANYVGKDIVRGYAKWFNVDLLCAVAELRLLGASVSDAREFQAKLLMAQQAKSRHKQSESKKQKALDQMYADSDETFSYIAGYTSGGAPYGTTWEELSETPSPKEYQAG